jgi:hypothetical protein
MERFLDHFLTFTGYLVAGLIVVAFVFMAAAP